VEQATDELRALLIDAVRLQLRADVPVGAYLSGGLDSSGIVAMIRGFTDTPVRTFSVAFEDGEFDESEHQQAMVRHLGTDHTTLRCTRRADRRGVPAPGAPRRGAGAAHCAGAADAAVPAACASKATRWC
jgi:asparagine synthase (glutamine-hydrolysing)